MPTTMVFKKKYEGWFEGPDGYYFHQLPNGRWQAASQRGYLCERRSLAALAEGVVMWFSERLHEVVVVKVEE